MPGISHDVGRPKNRVYIKSCPVGWALCEAATDQLHTLCRGTSDKVRAQLMAWVKTQKNMVLVDAPKREQK